MPFVSFDVLFEWIQTDMTLLINANPSNGVYSLANITIIRIINFVTLPIRKKMYRLRSARNTNTPSSKTVKDVNY